MSVPSELTVPQGLDVGPRVLRSLLAEHLSTFLEQVEESDEDHRVPGFVLRALESMTSCSDFTKGFLRLECTECKAAHILPLSCRSRLCPSCTGRTMSERAAFLVDRALPRVPFRQWVLTFPGELARHLAFDPELAAAVIRVFVRVLFEWQGRRAARAHPDSSRPLPAAMVWIQRFSDGAGLYFHLHTLVPDGVFVEREGTLSVDFLPLPAPSQADIVALVQRVAERLHGLIARCLARYAAAPVPSHKRSQAEFLQRCAQSMAQRIREPLGPALASVGVARPKRPLCARHAGFELHAAVRIRADDREGLERLCRYLGRPALALRRLRRLPDGRIELRLKRTWRGGVRKLVFEPSAFIARLCALVPPPRFHMVRAFGVFSNASPYRPYILPEPPGESAAVPTAPLRPARMGWADGLGREAKRVFQRDVTACPCGGRLRRGRR